MQIVNPQPEPLKIFVCEYVGKLLKKKKNFKIIRSFPSIAEVFEVINVVFVGSNIRAIPPTLFGQIKLELKPSYI